MFDTVKRFLDLLFVECERSPTGKHDWSETRFEDSIDKDRGVSDPYCRYCFVRLVVFSQYHFPPWC